MQVWPWRIQFYFARAAFVQNAVMHHWPTPGIVHTSFVYAYRHIWIRARVVRCVGVRLSVCVFAPRTALHDQITPAKTNLSCRRVACFSPFPRQPDLAERGPPLGRVAFQVWALFSSPIFGDDSTPDLGAACQFCGVEMVPKIRRRFRPPKMGTIYYLYIAFTKSWDDDADVFCGPKLHRKTGTRSPKSGAKVTPIVRAKTATQIWNPTHSNLRPEARQRRYTLWCQWRDVLCRFR